MAVAGFRERGWGGEKEEGSREEEKGDSESMQGVLKSRL